MATALALSACLGAVPAAAQNSELIATLAAQALQPLPDERTVEIRYLEDTELNLRLSEIVAQALQQRGYEVLADGDLLLTFDTSILSEQARETRVEMTGTGGNTGGNEIAMSLRLPTARTNAQPNDRRYRMTMTLSRSGEPPIWVGVAAAQKGSDRFTITRALAKELVGHVGQSVEEKTFLIF